MRKKEFREVQPDRTINSFQGNIVRFSGRDGRVGGQESSVPFSSCRSLLS